MVLTPPLSKELTPARRSSPPRSNLSCFVCQHDQHQGNSSSDEFGDKVLEFESHDSKQHDAEHDSKHDAKHNSKHDSKHVITLGEVLIVFSLVSKQCGSE